MFALFITQKCNQNFNPIFTSKTWPYDNYTPWAQGSEASVSILQGEIEQLTISKDSSAVSEQCSATRIPISTDDTHMYAMQGDDPNAFKDSTHGDRKPMMDYKSKCTIFEGG